MNFHYPFYHNCLYFIFLIGSKELKKKLFSDFENDGNKKFSNYFKLCETYCRLRPVFITFFITIVILKFYNIF